MKKHKYILTIAGFDPSAGAGIIADVKTFEQHKCLGMAIQTANTIQTENKFTSVNWIDEALIKLQLETLLDQYTFKIVKIGLIPSLEFLESIIDICLASNTKTKLIWDPVLAASAGFKFGQNLNNINQLLPKIFLITPNLNEVIKLSGKEDPMEGAVELSNYTKVLFKGGHNEKSLGKDYLISNKLVQTFNPKGKNLSEKHGSGCVYSSAIAVNLLKGHTLQKSILKSKRYIESYLGSHATLLGKHHI